MTKDTYDPNEQITVCFSSNQEAKTKFATSYKLKLFRNVEIQGHGDSNAILKNQEAIWQTKVRL